MGRAITFALGIAIVFLGVFVVLGSEQAPVSHAGAIERVLRDQGVPVKAVTVVQQWPNALPFYAYGEKVMPYQAAVEVVLPSGLRVAGFLTCTAPPHQCVVTMRELQMFSTPIPDITMQVDWWGQILMHVSKLITL